MADRIARTGGPPCRIISPSRHPEIDCAEALSRQAGGKRLFVKEIEEALLRDEIDLAVHSSKDMPAVLPDGLAVAARSCRRGRSARRGGAPNDGRHVTRGSTERPSGSSDAQSDFNRNCATIEELIAALGQHPLFGTGSVRRIAQLTRLMPLARFVNIRGNLDTRLRKLEAGDHDALVLAAAGLKRLGFASRISLTLPATAYVPAPGRGIVAIENAWRR